MSLPVCCAVIVAAGCSTRMGGGDSKQFIPLGGVPVLARTLAAFEKAKTISAIVVVTRAEDIDRVRGLAWKHAVQKLTAVVRGGASRQESVANGVAAVPEESGFLAIHDGARPLIMPEEIDRIAREAFQRGASTLAVPVKDTIKVADRHGFVASTPPRGSLWAVQTPQVFERRLYERAMREARRTGEIYTDDCQLIEKIGASVHLCPGSYQNLKLTTQEDVFLAEAIINEREQVQNRVCAEVRKKQSGGYMMRVGHGYDVHRFAEGRKLILGGVEIPHRQGLLGHSDADVLAHAVMDAMLGAAGLGDIGRWFPDTDPAYAGADSMRLLRMVNGLLEEKGWKLENLDCTVVAQEPKLKGHMDAMRENLAKACAATPDRINVKATTEEGLGFTGACEGVAAHAVCLICQSE